MGTVETIKAAALFMDGVQWTMAPPARHHHLIKIAYDETGKTVPPSAQGFVTSLNRFVDRKTALQIALASGQMKKTPHPMGLFSEDLW